MQQPEVTGKDGDATKATRDQQLRETLSFIDGTGWGLGGAEEVYMTIIGIPEGCKPTQPERWSRLRCIAHMARLLAAIYEQTGWPQLIEAAELYNKVADKISR